jgi:hypothetical protein
MLPLGALALLCVREAVTPRLVQGGGPTPGTLLYAAPVPVSRRPSAPQTASVTPARTRTSGCLTTASALRALSWDGRQRAVDTPRCAKILGKGALENLCCPWRGGAGRGACGGKN